LFLKKWGPRAIFGCAFFCDKKLHSLPSRNVLEGYTG
jgi:hypothetical protein